MISKAQHKELKIQQHEKKPFWNSHENTCSNINKCYTIWSITKTQVLHLLYASNVQQQKCQCQMTLESLVRSGNSRTNTALLNRLMGSQIAFLLSRSQAVKQKLTFEKPAKIRRITRRSSSTPCHGVEWSSKTVLVTVSYCLGQWQSSYYMIAAILIPCIYRCFILI